MQKTLKRYFPIFVLPTLIAFSFAFIIPFVMGVYLSFCKFKTITNAQFVGLGNYIKIFADKDFVNAFGFTLKFSVVSIVTINVFAFILALALTRKIKGSGTGADQKDQRNQPVPYRILHAEPDRWYHPGLYLAADDQCGIVEI